MNQTLDVNLVALLVLAFFVLAFFILFSPKLVRRLFYFWVIFLAIVIQITYNQLNSANDVQTKIFSSVDDLNRKIVCKVQMLNDKYSWRLKSSEVVQINGEDVNIVKQMGSQDFIKELEYSETVFCIGNSSHEGKKEEEEQRATRRAETFIKWIKEINPILKDKIHALDLGVNTKQDLESSSQRRIVIISIMQSDTGVNISQALRRGLTQNAILPFNVNDYSKFEIK